LLVGSGNHISRAGNSSTDQCAVPREDTVKSVSQRDRACDIQGNFIRSDEVALQFASFTSDATPVVLPGNNISGRRC